MPRFNLLNELNKYKGYNKLFTEQKRVGEITAIYYKIRYRDTFYLYK